MNTTLRAVADEQLVSVAADAVQLEGLLSLPERAEGIVLFAHGGGSSLYSTRNRFLAHVLHQVGLATLLINLLTHAEEAIDVRTQRFRLDVALLTVRLLSATDWLHAQPSTRHLRIGYLGDDIAGGAALLAAAERHSPALGAIAIRSGRTDLAQHLLPLVQVPTLLIVGSADLETAAMNQYAISLIRAEKQLEVISGASHLFAEPGALAEVARLASRWFKHYLTTHPAPAPLHYPAAPVCSDRYSYAQADPSHPQQQGESSAPSGR